MGVSPIRMNNTRTVKFNGWSVTTIARDDVFSNRNRVEGKDRLGV